VIPPGRSSAVGATFEQSAARADALVRTHTAAREPLRFAAGLLRAQARVVRGIESAARAVPLTGCLASDLDRVLALLREVPRFAAREGPIPLRDVAGERADEIEETARTRLTLFWSGDRNARVDYLSRAMLRPYVQVLREANAAPDRVRIHGRCPFCGGAPLAACRRSSAESDGAARSLVCGLCALEWPFQRILCPSCREESPDKLPSFASESHPSARIEACETCRGYVKSLDLTRDPSAVPEVDDLASLALDLWAIEQGFTRAEPGLAGL
jgi:FdhE protein